MQARNAEKPGRKNKKAAGKSLQTLPDGKRNGI
jgi:hypothetical protein